MDLRPKRIVLTGGAGFLGRAVGHVLAGRRCREVLVPRRAEYDLTDEQAVMRLYADLRPQVVIHLAAEVGGIGANEAEPGRFFRANMAMALHLIEHARRWGVEKFVLVGTTCAYPKHAVVPFREDTLWEGYPEETNAPYAIAKRAALVMLQAYHGQYGLGSACVLPANLYGPGDNFDPHRSHVIPGLVRRCLEAKASGAGAIICWGTGRASREFLYVDDAAEGVVRAAERLDRPEAVNLGTGQEITVADLADLIARLTGFGGEIRWDETRPDGQPRRRLDVSRAEHLLGWRAGVELEDGLRRTIQWFECERASRSHK